MASLIEYENDWTISAIKKEYAKKRRAFNKRIERLAEVASSPRIESYRKGGKKRQRSVSEIEQLYGRATWGETSIKKDWARRLAELDNLLEQRTLSLSGRAEIRRETISTLREHGYSSINNSNFDAFANFMKWAKDSGLLKQYDSNTIVEAYDTLSSGGEIDDDFLENILLNFQQVILPNTEDIFSDL